MAEAVVGRYKIKDRLTKILLADYFWSWVREVSAAEFSHNKSKYYYEASLSNAYITNTVEEYVESGQYDQVKEVIQRKKTEELEQTDGIYDFFTDYELFAAMARYVVEKAKENPATRGLFPRLSEAAAGIAVRKDRLSAE